MPGFGIMCSKILNQTFNSKYFIKMGKVAAMTQAQECMLQMGEDLPLSMVLYVMCLYLCFKALIPSTAKLTAWGQYSSS